MRRLLPLLIAALALLAALAAGPEAAGRLALRAGFPDVAARLLETPRWRGVALYEAGRYAEADAAFRHAGRSATYNRGNSLAVTGNYRLAVAYYEAVLYVNEADADALANRALVEPLIDAVISRGGRAPGRMDTIADPDALPGVGTYEMKIQALMRETRQQPRPRDTRQSVHAGEDWLTALPDDPGRYLKLRIAAERQRRIDNGTAVWQGGEPW